MATTFCPACAAHTYGSTNCYNCGAPRPAPAAAPATKPHYRPAPTTTPAPLPTGNNRFARQCAGHLATNGATRADAGLTPKRQAVLAYLASNPGQTAAQLQTALGAGGAVLSAMVATGHITGTAKGGYRLTPLGTSACPPGVSQVG